MNPSREQIEQIARLLAERFKAERVILFGSRAYGTPSPDSDVDLLVIAPFDCTPYRMTSQMLSAIRPTFGFDLVPRTPEDVRSRYDAGDPMIREALDHGIVLFQRAA